METAYIIDRIPTGAENAISRYRLAKETGLSDRTMRKRIQALREAGFLILNAQDGNGYYIADKDDINALMKQYRQDTARAMAILKRRKAIRRILKAAGCEV